MATITKTITQPDAVINAFADRKGYQTIVTNPDYTPAEGNETINDPEWVEPEGFNPLTDTIPQVPNPDFVPANGERTMPNPETRVEFVSRIFDEFVAKEFFGVFATEDARRAKLAEANDLAKQTVEAIKATIVTTV